MSIYFHTEYDRFSYGERKRAKRWLRVVIKEENKNEGTINIIFVDNDRILQLNTKYLSQTYFTDVIAFNFNEGSTLIGDIYIGVETVKSNSTKYKTPLQDELHRVIVHGLLHLMGYEDKEAGQKRIMTQKESHYLAKF